MSAPSSPASVASTTDSPELGFDTPSSVSRILGGEGCLGRGSPECPSTTTYALSERGSELLASRANPRSESGSCPASRPRSETTYELWVSNQRRELRQMDVAPSLTEPGGFTQAPFLLANTLKSQGGRGWSYDPEATYVSISSAAASPAKTSASPDDVPASKPENDPAYSLSSPASQTSLFNPEGMSSLRTYPDYFPAKADEISPSYSRRWPSSGFTTSPGVCWTADISECPSGGGVSSCLADVLQETVAPKYFLSPRAAAGILRRAEKRGRALPSHLLAALETVARTTTTPKADG